MKKLKSLFLAFLCLVFVAVSLPTNTQAASMPNMPVNKLKSKNKEIFSLLRTSVDPSVIQSNKNYNCVPQKLPQYVYRQRNVDLKVGECKFGDVGCELAACYNATIALSPATSRAGRKSLLSSYIYYAENYKYTMALNSSNIKKLAKILISTYSENTFKTFFIKLGLTLAPTSVIENYLGDLAAFKKAASFGTDPYAIPDILSKGGVCKASSAYSYSDLNMSVNAALTRDKSFKVYIVSFWNYDTLNACLDKGSGFHTICFYTQNGKLYSYNNGKSSTGPAVETSLYNMIGNSDRYIVGYCITLK